MSSDLLTGMDGSPSSTLKISSISKWAIKNSGFALSKTTTLVSLSPANWPTRPNNSAAIVADMIFTSPWSKETVSMDPFCFVENVVKLICIIPYVLE